MLLIGRGLAGVVTGPQILVTYVVRAVGAQKRSSVMLKVGITVRQVYEQHIFRTGVCSDYSRLRIAVSPPPHLMEYACCCAQIAAGYAAGPGLATLLEAIAIATGVNIEHMGTEMCRSP
jgi:hypothetical protein